MNSLNLLKNKYYINSGLCKLSCYWLIPQAQAPKMFGGKIYHFFKIRSEGPKMLIYLYFYKKLGINDFIRNFDKPAWLMSSHWNGAFAPHVSTATSLSHISTVKTLSLQIRKSSTKQNSTPSSSSSSSIDQSRRSEWTWNMVLISAVRDYINRMLQDISGMKVLILDSHTVILVPKHSSSSFLLFF